MIRKFSMATAVLMAASASALAADLPRRTPPPVFVPPPLFTWTGLYVGGQVGYTWGQDNSAGTLSAGGVPLAGYNTYNSPNGELGGAHIGYNYQISQFVVGVEGDVNGTDFNNAGTGSSFPAGAFVSLSTRIPIEGSARGRIGIAWDHWLFFATGGAAFADIEHSYALGAAAVGFLNDPANPYSKTRVGWTVGGGVEYALNNNWSVRAEYRYSDFGNNSDFVFSSPLFGGLAAANRSHVTQNAVTVGFSYKFDWYTPPAPVVAKY